MWRELKNKIETDLFILDILRPSPMRDWIAFLAAVIFCAISIVFAGPPKEERPVDSLSSIAQMGGQVDVGIRNVTGGARFNPDFVKAVSESTEWQKRAERYIDRLVGAGPETWNIPPAGMPVASDIVALQKVHTGNPPPAVRLQLLSIAGDALALEKYTELQFGSAGKMRSLALNSTDSIDVALAPETDTMWFRLYRPEERFFIFGTPSKTSEEARVSFQKLLAGGVIEVTLRASADAGASTAQLRLLSTVLPQSGLGAMRRVTRAPIIPRSGNLPNTFLQSGEVDALSPGDDILIDNDLRYTAVIVYGDLDLRERVRGFRLDTGEQIGIYAVDPQLFVAAVNNRAPVMLRIAGAQTEPFSYHVLAVSGKDDPGADIVLWYVSEYLMETSVDGLPMSNAQTKATTEWLKNAFRVRIGPSDLEKIGDPKLRAVFQALIDTSGLNDTGKH